MKKLLLAGVALAGLVAAGAASAADLPSRTAPAAPSVAPIVPLFTWSGFYVGVNAGYGFGDSDNSFFVPTGTFVTAPGATGVVSFTDENDGFVGGAQVGYNFQFGSFVVGAEADLQFADLGNNDGVAFIPAGFPATYVPAGRGSDLEWFGTVRARAGFAFDRMLVYATGGFAFGGGDDNNGFNGIINNGDDDIRTGWALGGGVEYAFTNNLTLGLEGLWVNLDRGNRGGFIGTETVGGVVTPVFVAGTDEDDDDFTVVRARLNYKF